MLTCPNNACGKVFAKPLKTINLQRSSKEHYCACPYCLTEITVIDTQNKMKAPNCTHYFGYMSIQEHKNQMPEECMLCSQIMECMEKRNEPAKRKI